ncbi:glycerol-3-phosphate regulon repressor [Vibrio sp. RC586]|uniref:DeoR/GlpR family DNA-binding transcription regulator n=1 Tax=Vibrio sp. RC586 TaxID=675815 RepID=UPI0001BB7DC7|nr:DeoR/GlpR family DNA-binding transcription regulator [Vibrio sp. RC586]EEY99758.1 glycerol-3-phosphate regulon repressor [Vibrio sp. RC586]
MQATQRRQQILRYVWQHGEILTNQAIELFGFSAPTVRRDFLKLVQSHPSIHRTHGGIRFNQQKTDLEFEFDIKQQLQTTAKQEIAAKAILQIEPNDCLFLDSGSTCYELAKYLKEMEVTVITTDLNIAHLLAGTSKVEVYVVGGKVRNGFFSIGDSMAVESLRQFSAPKAFMSCDAISLDAGITNSSMFEVGVKKNVIQQCQAVYMLADDSKFERIEPYAVAALSVISYLITNSELDSRLKNQYLARGIQMI